MSENQDDSRVENGVVKPEHNPFNRRRSVEPTPEPQKNVLTYDKIARNLEDPALDMDERVRLTEERNKIIDDIAAVDRGRYIGTLQFNILDTMRNTEWDQIYGTLLNMATNEENSFYEYAP